MPSHSHRRAHAILWILLAVCIVLPSGACASPTGPVVARIQTNAPVTLTEDGDHWTLDNGIVKAVIDRRHARLESLFFHGKDVSGHERGAAGVWEQDPGDAPDVKQTITVNPSSNGGERAEVSVAGKTGGTAQLAGSAGGGTMCDLEVRFALGRGDSGVYTYAIFSHPAAYGAMGVSESRFITRLDKSFDWISVDADRNMLACAPTDWGTGVVVHAKEQRIMSKGVYKNTVEHKYSYTAVQYKTPAYGWSSTKGKVGVWFINPSIEYLSGGASKQELDCHFGDSDNPDPIILDYWRGTHYGGGASCNIAAGEEWSKVVGPIFVYCNALEKADDATPQDLATLHATEGNPIVPPAWTGNATALWQEALEQAKREKSRWPYDWVRGVDYPHKDARGAVTGKIVLVDPQAATTKLPHLTVGLAHPDYARPAGRGRGGFGRGGNANIDWVHDAKFYQFWNDGAEDGSFAIESVRPGDYTLHAFADGVLGEFAKTDVKVEAGKTIDLGALEWKPVRHGKQIWEIGVPDRTGGEFFKGDGANYWLWGWGLRYMLLFPNDITYTVGKSDWRNDWFFQQTPHSVTDIWINPAAKDPANQRFGWVKAESLTEYPQTYDTGPWDKYGWGRACTWTIKFNMDAAPKSGQGTLRVALAGADGYGGLAVGVDGTAVGTIRPFATNALRYNTNKSVWYEYLQTFDAKLLKPGENAITLTVPEDEVTSGVVYDYLRLELDDSAKTNDARSEDARQ